MGVFHVFKIVQMVPNCATYHIFGNVIRCSTLWLWVGYFIYYKFTPVFFNGCWMLFNSIKEINRLRKEINRSLSKGLSNIYLKGSIEKKWRTQNFDFKSLKSSSKRSVFGKLQLTQKLLNFQTSCCNLKIRGLGAKLYVAFLLFLFWNELWRFQVNESMLFVEQKYKV